MTRIAIGLLILAVSGCDVSPGEIRFDKRSEFERILVVDKADKRYLRFGKANSGNQSVISLSDPNAVPVEYIRISFLGMLMTPVQERVLMIGLGGGIFTSLLRRHYPNLWIDAVEIDPVVVEAAKDFFGVCEDDRFRIHVEDGEKFVRKTLHSYDLVLLDAYGGEGIPQEIVSPAFFDAVKRILSGSGVAVLNLWDEARREPSIANVFRNTFQKTACIRTKDGYNLVLFGKATDMPGQADLIKAARRFTSESNLSFDLGEVAERLEIWYVMAYRDIRRDVHKYTKNLAK